MTAHNQTEFDEFKFSILKDDTKKYPIFARILKKNKDLFAKYYKGLYSHQYIIVDGFDIKKINAELKINIDTFKKSKLFRKSINKFKVLSNGNFKSKIDIEADYSSKNAKEKIEKAGGQITVKNQSK